MLPSRGCKDEVAPGLIFSQKRVLRQESVVMMSSSSQEKTRMLPTTGVQTEIPWGWEGPVSFNTGAVI